MKNSVFLNFLLLLIFKHKTKHLSIFFISILLVFILSSVIFISTSLKNDALINLEVQPDIIVQKLRSGKGVDTPISWGEEIININGISNINLRFYGKYWYEPNEQFFTIVGIDLFEKQTSENIKQLIKDIDIKEFLSKNYMIIGAGVKKHFDYYQFFDYYTFRKPNRKIEKVYIYSSLPKNIGLFSNDIILMNETLAQKILGIDEDKATDIAITIPNKEEIENIKIKLILQHFDMRIIKKEDIKKEYEKLFNYKGGLFLSLYIISLITFMLIIYQRYSIINSYDKKEIGILKSVGWGLIDIIKLKLLENILIAIFAFFIGFFFAFIYVFIFDAPILIDIFLGSRNLSNDITLTPYIDFSIFTMLFLFFIIPFISSIIIPVWRIAILDSIESLR
jgi:ABC-type lipoprotein release transport system permease subunit